MLLGPLPGSGVLYFLIPCGMDIGPWEVGLPPDCLAVTPIVVSVSGSCMHSAMLQWKCQAGPCFKLLATPVSKPPKVCSDARSPILRIRILVKEHAILPILVVWGPLVPTSGNREDPRLHGMGPRPLTAYRSRLSAACLHA